MTRHGEAERGPGHPPTDLIHPQRPENRHRSTPRRRRRHLRAARLSIRPHPPKASGVTTCKAYPRIAPQKHLELQATVTRDSAAPLTRAARRDAPARIERTTNEKLSSGIRSPVPDGTIGSENLRASAPPSALASATVAMSGGSPVKVADLDVRVEERLCRCDARAIRLRCSTSSHGVPRFSVGTGTLSATSCRLGVLASLPGLRSTRKSKSSPSWSPSASRARLGIVTGPFDGSRR